MNPVDKLINEVIDNSLLEYSNHLKETSVLTSKLIMEMFEHYSRKSIAVINFNFPLFEHSNIRCFYYQYYEKRLYEFALIRDRFLTAV